MKNLKKWSKRAAFLLTLCLTVSILTGACLPVSNLSAAKNTEEDRITQGDIDKIQDKLEQLEKEQNRLNAELEAAKKEANQQAALIVSYEKVIENYKKDISTTEELIAAYTDLITLKTSELADKQNEYDRMLRSYKDKLRFTHEAGNFSYLQMVFSSDNFTEFLSSLFRFGDILDHTNKIMQKLERCAVEIEIMLSELNVAKAEQDAHMLSLISKKTEIEQKMAEAEEEKKQLDDDAAALETLIKYYAEQQAATDKELTQLLKDYQSQIERDKAQWMLWPLDTKNNYITSTFGGRIHPVHNYAHNHSGIDVAGPSSGSIAGANIYATLPGVVIISGIGSGYGNYIVIDHGDGFTSVYAHCSKLLVKKGQKVKRGDLIGYVGMTGTATGYHLHFELRQDGEKLDPLDYPYLFNGEHKNALDFVKWR